MIMPHCCPVCEKEFVATGSGESDYFPFCSERCKKVDFHRWWDGRYSIVEDVDPQVAEFLAQDPNISVDEPDSE